MVANSLGQIRRFENPKEREKASKAGKRRYEDPEQRKAMSKAQKHRYENPEQRKIASKASKQVWDSLSPEERMKHGRGIKRWWASLSPEERVRRGETASKTTKQYWDSLTPEERKKRTAGTEARSRAAKHRFEDPEQHRLVSEALKRHYEDPKVRKIASDTNKRVWALMTSDERVKQVGPAIEAARHVSKPNGAEQKLHLIICSMGFSIFTGGGSDKVRIGNKYPDFVHDQLPVVVELFGDYWHDGDNGKGRQIHFAKHGYCMVIIWERELSHPEVIRHRIRQALRWAKRYQISNMTMETRNA